MNEARPQEYLLTYGRINAVKGFFDDQGFQGGRTIHAWTDLEALNKANAVIRLHERGLEVIDIDTWTRYDFISRTIFAVDTRIGEYETYAYLRPRAIRTTEADEDYRVRQAISRSTPAKQLMPGMLAHQESTS